MNGSSRLTGAGRAQCSAVAAPASARPRSTACHGLATLFGSHLRHATSRYPRGPIRAEAGRKAKLFQARNTAIHAQVWATLAHRGPRGRPAGALLAGEVVDLPFQLDDQRAAGRVGVGLDAA